MRLLALGWWWRDRREEDSRSRTVIALMTKEDENEGTSSDFGGEDPEIDMGWKVGIFGITMEIWLLTAL